jgi:hypothetical protein
MLAAVYIAWTIFTPADHSYGWYWFKTTNGRFEDLPTCERAINKGYETPGIKMQCLPEGEEPK